ncbi:MAG TPA: polyprenol phosphomannose-dependent alpha 1,6 mannosyltransferase MptB [Mycobacteriales bacterium]|nr:polyprenol phosphomannose-dependent alpha 1,6 mannosyltransferase MptB [Mycobacteriales bacterium]
MTAPAAVAALRETRLARAATTRWTGWGTAHLRTVVLVGFAGSALLALGSLGAGAPPVYDPVKRTPVIAVLRDGVGEKAALAFVYVGLAVLGMAWLYLGRALLRREEGTDPGRLLKIAGLWAAPLVVCVPLFSRDLYAYAAQAQIAHAGLDPYSVGPVSLPGPFLDEISGMWVDTPAPYGPLFLGLGRAVATVTGDRVVTTVFAMRLLAVAGVLLTAKYLPRLARAAGGDPRVAIWLGIANPLVLAHFIAGGHNDALMVGLVVAGLTIAIEATEERWVALGVVLCSAAVLVKAPAAVAVAFLAWVWARQLTGRWVLVRASVRTGAVAAATIALLTGVTGLGFGWINQLNASGQVVAWTSIPTGIGMLVEVLRGIPNFVTYQDPVISAARLIGQVATAGILLWLWLKAGRIGWVRAAALALLVVVVLGPVVQPWYVLWGLTLLGATKLDRRVGLVAAGACFWLSMMIAPQGSNLFLEVPPVLAMATAAAVATFAVLGRTAGEPSDGPPERVVETVNPQVVPPITVNGRDLGKPVASV